jgi:hypothetical protein
VAVLAVAAVIFSVWKLSSAEDGKNTPPAPVEYKPSEEEENEMLDAVRRLIADNYKVLQLFYTVGMPHEEEPYGNRPEGGYYNAISGEYNSVDEIFALVDNTYIAEAALWIKTDSGGNGAVYADKKGKIGINENFEPVPYNLNWSTTDFKLIFISDTECGINITLKNSDGGGETKNMKMDKGTDGIWRLENIII